MITEAHKQKIMEAISANRENYPSDAKHAASLGITTSVYSAVKNGQTDKVLSDANWISIARRLGVNLRGGMEWKAAHHIGRSRGFAIRGVFGAESPVERHRAKLRLVHDGSGRLEGKDKPLDRV